MKHSTTHTHKDQRANESVKYIYIIYFANQRISKNKQVKCDRQWLGNFVIDISRWQLSNVILWL